VALGDFELARVRDGGGGGCAIIRGERFLAAYADGTIGVKGRGPAQQEVKRVYICKSRFLRRAEVWFDEEPNDIRMADWILYFQRSEPPLGARWKYFYTYVIDLTQTGKQLEAKLNADTAYKIRRARERDKIRCESCNVQDRGVLDRFEEMYNAFAATKGLGRLDRGRIEAMAAAGVLDLSMAKDLEGNALVYHANYHDRCRARSLYLPSLFRQLSDSKARNLIGRANRYLTWNDILRYKSEGLKWFDFGGWYAGDDPAMATINDFKKGFGGQVLREYECEQIVTLKGWLVLNIARLLKRARRYDRPVKLPDAPEPEVQVAVTAPSA